MALERRMDIRVSLRRGFLTGFINILVIVLGLTTLVGAVTDQWFDPPSATPGMWLVLLLVAVAGGAGTVRRERRTGLAPALASGLLAGLANGVLVGAFVWAMSALLASGAKVRQWLAQITPEAIDPLTLGRAPMTAGLVLIGALAAAGLVGAALAYLGLAYGKQGDLRESWSAFRYRVSSAPLVKGASESRWTRYALVALGLAVLVAAPLVMGQYGNYALGTVGIYIILGLGLNIVVGLAGILNLGYAAFFAIGAYTVALLTAPEPHAIQMDFWYALPAGIFLTLITGVLLCIPVLRTRGDYLAIVTLGFGEIVRILAKSDALTAFTSGPKGVRDVGGPQLFGLNLATGTGWMYIIIVCILLVAFMTHRLQNSRVGRAWMAMREDEDVAKAMGIHTLKYKILAFAIGAAFAGLAGVIAASRNMFAGPEDFTLLVSINVLCLVIIGGMGSIPGVIVGALVLKGLPEMLRELDDYRFLVFGALLIIMMILRPQGLWPSERVRQSLQSEPAVPEPPPPGTAAEG